MGRWAFVKFDSGLVVLLGCFDLFTEDLEYLGLPVACRDVHIIILLIFIITLQSDPSIMRPSPRPL